MRDELKADIKRLISDATEVPEGHRADLFDRYMGEPYGDEKEGRSKFVDTTVSDAVEALLPDLMDVFTSSERIVNFPAMGEQDREQAKIETAAVNHVFWQMNNGFENLYVWMKEALIQQNSYVWRGWVDKEWVEIDEYEDLSFPELIAIIGEIDGDYEFLEQSGFGILKDEATGEEVAIPEMGEDGQPAPISVKIRCEKTEKRYVIEPFPQEEFFGTPRWGKVSLNGIPCCGRMYDMRLAKLKAMGFDVEDLDTGGEVDDIQTSGRHSTQDSDEQEADDEGIVKVYETYAYLDLRDNGKEVLCKIWAHKDGTEVLKWASGKEAIEEITECQITAWTPYIVPHRHIGRSAAELVDDVQQVNTVLMRQLFDNIYATNYGRPYYDENMASEQTFTDLQNPSHGAPVRTGGAPIEWFTPPSVAGSVLPILEKMSAVKEERTGATRYNQGLDAESLNKTASGMNMILNAGQKKAKLVARTLAETGLRELFLGIHADMRKGPLRSLMLPVKGVFQQLNPREWRKRDQMTVEVGMGRGDRDEIRAGLTMLGGVQRELKAGGSPMVTDGNLYATIARVAETFGITDLTPFLTDPQMIPPKPPQPPQPDPMMMGLKIEGDKVAAKAQHDMAALQQKEAEQARGHERFLAELQLKQFKDDRDEAKVASDIQEQEDRLQLDRDKAANDDDFKRDKLEIDALTGHMRDVAKAVTSEPAVSAQEVTDDR